MKKLTIIFSYLLIASLLSCSKSHITDPEDVGDRAFEILQHLGNMSKDEYMSSFMTDSELRKLAANSEVDQGVREDIIDNLDSKRYEMLKSDYENIKTKGMKENIDWNELSFIRYEFSEDWEGGVLSTRGDLYCSIGSKSLVMEVVSIFDGNEYKLARMWVRRY